ncbi:MAG TPA: glycosyltransferase family 9 protein [Chloroflexota bacterium]|nr:glycosyltransferase family 9 protein [Chloroflexota bacterium]
MSGWAVARAAADRVAWLVCGAWGLAVWLHERRHAPALDPAAVERILVIRLDLLGDLVFTAPLVAALRDAYPRAELVLLTTPYTAPLGPLLPGIDRVLTLDIQRLRRPAGWRYLGEALGLVARLRRERFDLCVAVHGRPAGMLALASGARVRVGYRAHAYPFAFNRPLAGYRYAWRRHEVEYCLELARAVGADAPGRPLLLAPPRDRRGGGLLPGERYLVLHPGASNGTAKRWPPEAWAALGKAAVQRFGRRVVVTGAESEDALVAMVCAQIGKAALARIGSSLIDLAGVLAAAEAVVAADTGPLHLAAALGTPVVGLYGPTDPAHTGPRGPLAAAVRRPVPCGPCYDLRGPAECRLPTRSAECLTLLPPQAVLAALAAVLDRARQAAVR